MWPSSVHINSYRIKQWPQRYLMQAMILFFCQYIFPDVQHSLSLCALEYDHMSLEMVIMLLSFLTTRQSNHETSVMQRISSIKSFKLLPLQCIHHIRSHPTDHSNSPTTINHAPPHLQAQITTAVIIICIPQMNSQSGFNKTYCEDFQSELTYERIDSIWKSFREAGNSIEGRVAKPSFKKVLNKFGIKNEKFLERLFERFKLDKSNEKSEKQQIDLQDLVIGLALLSRISFLEKVKFVFYLTDLDEDGCLSLQEIENMIERVQKIFCKQNSSAKVDSYSLLFELAHKKAGRNYGEMLVLLQRNNKELKDNDGSLITSDEFIQALKMSRDLYVQQKFFPLTLSLFEIIDNVACEPTIKISENVKKTFVEFRQELCSIMQQTKNEKEVNLIKYPGKVDIIKNDRVVETLPNTEKNVQKKLTKNNAKNKPNNALTKNTVDVKEQNEQKSAEQNLETYKLKVRKMIETKEDPRLNVRFDQMFKKA